MLFSLPLAYALSLAPFTAVLCEALHIRQASSPSRSDSIISAAWYTGWHASFLPLSNVSWTKYTHMTYAFGITTPNPNVLSLDPSDEGLLPQFVSAAHQNGVKASLSIGGWTGSRFFSSNVGNAANRTAFVNTLVNVVRRFNLDGLDFDWEYPGSQGIGCNVLNPQDTRNFILFLQQLRNNSVGSRLILSAAVYLTPWVGPQGTPLTDTSAFASVLDFLIIMNYDVGSNSTIGAGPSSPLNDACAPVGARFGSAVSAVAAWTASGIPSRKIVLGLPAYGHSFVVTSNPASGSGSNTNLAPYPSYDPNQRPLGDQWDGGDSVDVCGVSQRASGTYAYRGLMETGFLNRDGSTAPGISYRFDDCSQTPFLYNSTSKIYVSYEDPSSYTSKGAFIRSSNLGGFAIWEAAGDVNDALLNAALLATQGQTSTTQPSNPSNRNGGPPLPSQATSGPSSQAAASGSPQSNGALSSWRSLVCLCVILGAWSFL